MNHIIAFSGGLASAVMAEIIIAEHGKENCTLLFHDTKTEPYDNDRFRKEAAEYLGLEITEVSDGRNIWQVFADEGYLGNGRNTPCSRILKQELSLEYVLNHQPCILYLGFTMEEWRRAQRTSARYLQRGIETRFPLISQKINKEDCHKKVKDCWNIKQPAMYAWAEHANCIPCVKGAKAYWGLIYKHERAAWERMSKAEEEYGHTLFTEAGSLKEELHNCIRLANDYENKQEAERLQYKLFDFPCECIA